jgi:hypothetical protein
MEENNHGSQYSPTVACMSNKERDFFVLGRFRVSFGSWSSEEESSYGVLGHRM